MKPIPILLFHSVGYTSAPEYQRWCVEPALFAEQLHALREAEFDFMTVSELVDARRRGALPARPLLVTFDDGRADFVEHAVAPLAEVAIPSTMYVVTGHVGGTASWLDIPEEADSRLMTWADVRDVVAAGHEVGAHSVTHPQLDLLPRATAAAEVSRSRDHLEDELGTVVRSFAYPHGYHRNVDVKAVYDAGFDSACAVRDSWSHDQESPFRLSRLIVDGGTSPEQLLTRLQADPTFVSEHNGLRQVAWRHVRQARRLRRAVVGA